MQASCLICCLSCFTCFFDIKFCSSSTVGTRQQALWTATKTTNDETGKWQKASQQWRHWTVLAISVCLSLSSLYLSFLAISCHWVCYILDCLGVSCVNSDESGICQVNMTTPERPWRVQDRLRVFENNCSHQQ